MACSRSRSPIGRELFLSIMKRFLTSLAFVTILSFSFANAFGAPPPKAKLKAVDDFSLKDQGGKVVSLRQFKDRDAIILMFMGTQCPINNAYLPRLAEIAKDYGPKGVQVLGINSNQQDSAKDVIEHARKFAIPYPVLKDENNIIADRIGVWRTPEVILLDKERRVRYQGRIDDQFSHDTNRPMPTRRDLIEALDEVLAGKDVSIAQTSVSGCYIGRVTPTKKDGDITYTKHISRIVQKHCQECHRAGQAAPMPLLTYEDMVSWSRMIHEVVRDKRMPPWYADPRFGKFSNDRTLPDEDRTTLLAWVESGMPRGKEEDLPPPRKFTDGWTIGTPDAVLHMPVAFDVPAERPKAGIPYKHYTIETTFDEDKWVERAEARADATEVVHHILVYVVPPGKRFVPGSVDSPVLVGMAPGEQPFFAREGMAKHLPKGSKLLFQVHYTPNGRAQKDRSFIGLVFAKKPPRKKVVTIPIFNAFFHIPAGADNHRVEATHTVARDTHIVGFMPHMHLRGKDFTYRAIYPDKKEETLLVVPRFNFNWQGVYRLEEPLRMPKGTKLHCIAHFDNSKDNPNNPDPTVSVNWGDQTWQEMMVGWVDFAYDMKDD